MSKYDLSYRRDELKGRFANLETQIVTVRCAKCSWTRTGPAFHRSRAGNECGMLAAQKRHAAACDHKRELMRIRNARYAERHPRGTRTEYQRAWYEANKERVRATQLAYRERNRERINARERERYHLSKEAA